MKRLLLVLLIGMGVLIARPSEAATANDSCDALLRGTKYGSGGYKCLYMCDTIDSATTTDCDVIPVPFKRVRSLAVEIYSPTATNCTFDGGTVEGYFSSSSQAAGHKVVYGTLDDDSPGAAPGNTTGVQVPEGQFIRPYVSVQDLVTGGTCTTTNAIDILGIFQEDAD
jgi:hypothetical protein